MNHVNMEVNDTKALFVYSGISDEIRDTSTKLFESGSPVLPKNVITSMVAAYNASRAAIAMAVSPEAAQLVTSCTMMLTDDATIEQVMSASSMLSKVSDLLHSLPRFEAESTLIEAQLAVAMREAASGQPIVPDSGDGPAPLTAGYC